MGSPIVPGDPDERMYGVVFGSMRNGPRAGYLRANERLLVLTNLLKKGERLLRTLQVAGGGAGHRAASHA
jgi:hypothetical protein